MAKPEVVWTLETTEQGYLETLPLAWWGGDDDDE